MKKTEHNYKGILHKEIDRLSKINPRFHRISSMLLDHIIMTIVIVPPMILIMVLVTSNIIKTDFSNLNGIFFSLMFVYINKDFLNGKSPAKRILGYQVVNRKTNKTATELQCCIRNLTIAIAWPLEVIIGFINPERRIGDYIANTKVITSEKEALKSVFVDIKKKKLNLNFIIILIVGIVYFYALNLLLQNIN